MYKGERVENLIKILLSTWVYIGFVELSHFSNIVPVHILKHISNAWILVKNFFWLQE